MLKEYIQRSMTYTEYLGLIDGLLLEGRTTGSKQSEAMVGYARLNRQRIRRLEKTLELTTAVSQAAKRVDRKMIWLIITEGWCGDAAQNLPAIEKIAAESINIETRYLLRDENLGLIDQFLTDGGRAIPKLIAVDAETFSILGIWGARPASAQAFYREMKLDGLAKPLIMENLQRWYNADRNVSIQNEFEALLPEWVAKGSATVA